MSELDEIRARDEAATVCAVCFDKAGGYHDITLEACQKALKTKPCGDPAAHHEFVAGEFPEYMTAERDRRTLLTLLLNGPTTHAGNP